LGDTRFKTTIESEGLESWHKIPMIVSERGLARQRLNQWLSDNNLNANIYSEVSGNEAIVSMVSLGCGIGFIPQIVLDNSPLKDSVEKFSIQPDIPHYEVGACVQTRRLKNPIVQALWQTIGLETKMSSKA